MLDDTLGYLRSQWYGYVDGSMQPCDPPSVKDVAAIEEREQRAARMGPGSDRSSPRAPAVGDEPMTPVERAFTPASLISLATADGMVEFSEDVPLGRTYHVDLQTRRSVVLYNLDACCSHQKEVVQDESGGWLPVECLKVLVN